MMFSPEIHAQSKPDPAKYSLDDLNLLSDPEPGFDAITALATELFEVSVSLVSIIDAERDRQFFKSQRGLPDPWAKKSETPLSHSFCQHVKSSAQPLVVENAKEHSLVCDNLAISDLGVIAYLGVPIFGPAGTPVGALCIIQDQPRSWSEKDVGMLQKLGRCVSNEIRLKAAALTSETLFKNLMKKHQDTTRYNAIREAIFAAFMAPDISTAERFEAMLETGCAALSMESAVITKVEYDRLEILFSFNQSQNKALPSYGVSGTLSSFLVSGKNEFHFRDMATSNAVGWRDFQGGSPSSFAGVPLLVDGVMFGTLELSASHPRATAWTPEDLSVLSILSMLSSVYLGLVGKLESLKRSEGALLNHMLSNQNKHFAATN